MAARNRRRTTWVGGDTTPLTLASLGTNERTILESDNTEAPPPGSTLIRIIGNITTTTTRTSIGGTANAPENAIIRVGLMVEDGVGFGSSTIDLDDPTQLGDERWLWVQTKSHRITTHLQRIVVGGTEVDRFANYDASSFPTFDVDVRAKRRWEDPCSLWLHCTAIGEVSAVTLRPALRLLFALP